MRAVCQLHYPRECKQGTTKTTTHIHTGQLRDEWHIHSATPDGAECQQERHSFLALSLQNTDSLHNLQFTAGSVLSCLLCNWLCFWRSRMTVWLVGWLVIVLNLQTSKEQASPKERKSKTERQRTETQQQAARFLR